MYIAIPRVITKKNAKTQKGKKDNTARNKQ